MVASPCYLRKLRIYNITFEFSILAFKTPDKSAPSYHPRAPTQHHPVTPPLPLTPPTEPTHAQPTASAPPLASEMPFLPPPLGHLFNKCYCNHCALETKCLGHLGGQKNDLLGSLGTFTFSCSIHIFPTLFFDV